MAGVLGGFAAVASANTLVMTVLARRRELGMLRLVGATRLQVMRMLRWEGLLVSVAGVVLGTAIAAVTLVPMMRGLTGSPRTYHHWCTGRSPRPPWASACSPSASPLAPYCVTGGPEAGGR